MLLPLTAGDPVCFCVYNSGLLCGKFAKTFLMAPEVLMKRNAPMFGAPVPSSP